MRNYDYDTSHKTSTFSFNRSMSDLYEKDVKVPVYDSKNDSKDIGLQIQPEFNKKEHIKTDEVLTMGYHTRRILAEMNSKKEKSEEISYEMSY